MIYFLQVGNDGPIKIGRSNNPEARVTDIQVGNPFPVNLLLKLDVGDNWDNLMEHSLHSQFARYRLQGEWFAPVPALYEKIQELSIEASKSVVDLEWIRERILPCSLTRLCNECGQTIFDQEIFELEQLLAANSRKSLKQHLKESLAKEEFLKECGEAWDTAFEKLIAKRSAATA